MEFTTVMTSLIASLPNRGFVRTCPAGCVHVTYGRVTLDFPPGEFREFVETLERYWEDNEDGLIELRYCHALLYFSREEFQEFFLLVTQGWRELSVGRHETALMS